MSQQSATPANVDLDSLETGYLTLYLQASVNVRLDSRFLATGIAIGAQNSH